MRLALMSIATAPTPHRDALPMHAPFMLIMTALFILVFAIMAYSLRQHRKAQGVTPGGRLQWLWALVPFAIVLFIDLTLMGAADFQH